MKISHLVFLAVGFLSCTDSAGPQTKTPRDYAWQISELPRGGSPQQSLRSLQGSDPNSLIACGFNSIYPSNGSVVRTNNSTWQIVEFPSSIQASEFWDHTVVSPSLTLFAGQLTYGSSLSGAITDSAVLLSFDGASWQSLLPSHLGTPGLTSVWASDASHILAGSENGRILTYADANWSASTLKDNCTVWDIRGTAPNPYAIAASPESLFVYQRMSGQWTLLNAVPAGPLVGGMSARLFYLEDNRFYTAYGRNLYEHSGGGATLMRTTLGGFSSVGGTSSSNLIAIGHDGSLNPSIEHFNGTDWQSLTGAIAPLPERFQPLDLWMTGSQVFIVGDDGTRSYILKGQ